MSDQEPEPGSFEERLRELAREVSESIERAANQIDIDEIAEAIGLSGERARELADVAGRWLSTRFETHDDEVQDEPVPWDAQASAAEEEPPAATEQPRRRGGPHPLDTPTEEQGLALSALDSGRWRVEPGSTELIVDADGPGPVDPTGIVGELRARDWIAASGEVTLVGQDALRRWLGSARPSS
jgi:hypothetical protein